MNPSQIILLNVSSGVVSSFIFNATISSNTQNYNLKSAAIAAGWNQVQPLQATITINNGVYVGSTGTGNPAFRTGSTFPGGTILSLINNGIIIGAGGQGGTGMGATGGAGSAGAAGGGALMAEQIISITNNGTIAGGGGGGGGGGRVIGYSSTTIKNPCDSVGAFWVGGSGGGGGAGWISGAGGGIGYQYPDWVSSLGGINPTAGITGTNSAGGAAGTPARGVQQNTCVLINQGYSGGAGGGRGAAGATGTGGYSGGAAGYAVSGNSYITWIATGSRLGPIS